MEAEIKRLTHTGVPPSPALSAFLAERGTGGAADGCSLIALLRRPQLHYEELISFDPGRPDLPPDVREQVEISVKYEGYIRGFVWRPGRSWRRCGPWIWDRRPASPACPRRTSRC